MAFGYVSIAYVKQSNQRENEMDKFTSPVAPCKYAHLQQPNVDANGVYKPRFKITLVLDPKNTEHKELLTHISSLDKDAKGLGKKTKEELTAADKEKLATKSPVKKQKDTDGNYTEFYEITFGTSPDFIDHVPTFDSQGSPIFREKNFVANDSEVIVSWAYNYYTQGVGGVSLYLKGVQIIKLIEWEGASAEDLGFDKVEGYVESNPNAPSQTAEPSDTDEDVPF